MGKGNARARSARPAEDPAGRELAPASPGRRLSQLSLSVLSETSRETAVARALPCPKDVLSRRPRHRPRRVLATLKVAFAVIVFISGLIATASIESGISQIGFRLFILGILIAGVYLLIRPPFTGGAESA